jgi:PAS domain S-box-containing protein
MDATAFLRKLTNTDAGIARLARARPRVWWKSVLIGVGCACVALFVRWAANAFYSGVTGFIILLPGVILAALAGGRTAGFTATIVALLGGWIVAGPGAVGVGVGTPMGRIATVNFLLVGAFSTLVAAALRKTVARLDRSIGRISETEGRLELISEHAPVMLWMSDATGKCVHLNRDQKAFWNAPPDINDFDFAATIHPDDRERVLGATMVAIEARAAFEVEARSRRGDGQWRMLRTEARPRIDRDGCFLGMIGVNIDVTEARAAEADLRQSRERFRAAVEAVQGILWTNTAEGRMEGDQPGWTALTGQTREDYEGYGWASAIHPDDAGPTVEAWNAAVAQRRVFDFEHRLRTASGEFRHYSIRAVPTLDAAGEVRHWVGVHTDISRYREAEAALRESEARFRLLADTAPAPVWMTNPEAEVEFVNLALEQFYGHPADQILGHVWKQAMHPDDMAGVAAIQADARPSRSPYGFEARFKRADGAWRWMRVAVKPRFDGDSAFLGYVGISFDVTEAREALAAVAAQERRQTILLELSDRLRDIADPAIISSEICAVLGRALDIGRVGLGEIDVAAGTISVRETWTDGLMDRLSGVWRMEDFGPALIAEFLEGQAAAVDDVTLDPRTAAVSASFAAIDTRTVIAAPVFSGGTMRALLFAHGDQARVWSDDDLALIEEIAARAWAEIERARAQTEVRESEARFRAIADTAPVLIWVTQADRQRAFVNQAYVAFNGGTYEEARTADWRAVLHPDDQARILAESLAGEATREPFSLEGRYLRADGEYRWLKSFSRPRFGAGDEVIGFVGVAFDVSDIRETNARLAASAAERDAILGQLAEGVIVTDPDGRIIFVNDAAVRHHGVEALEVTPDDYTQAYHLLTEDGQPYPVEDLPLTRAVKHGETVLDARWRIARPDGSVVLAVGNARPVTGPDGAQIGAVLTLRDETARLTAERRLMESETRFRTVSDSAPALIWMLDAEGRPSFVNRRYRIFFDIDSEDEVADAWRKLAHPDDLAPFTDAFRSSMDRHERIEQLIRVNHPRLGIRWLRCEGIPRFDGAGVFQGYVGANMDVTEAKQAEDDLKRINELLEERVGEALAEKAKAEADLMHAQRMEAVGRLTGGVAHDFNNLLTVVIGALDIILRSPDDAAKRQKLGEAALSAARRGERLTHQLLAFSRRQALRPEPVDLNGLIRESEPLLRRAVGEAIEFKLKLKRGGARVSVDPAQFEAALLNLIVNARDAVGERGAIAIQTSDCRVEPGEAAELAAGDYVCIAVADDGEGMAPDIIARVFEPFFTTKSVGKGTGLGLSQVYGFARQSGGGVKIRSNLGEGTEIRLYLPPLNAGTVIPVEAARPASRPIAPGGRLLLVEDDASVAAVALDLLTDFGLEVTATGTAPEALEVLKTERFDIMLTDVVMPGGMNGIELARLCATGHPTMRVILTSGYAGEDVDLALADAPWPFLKKPYSAEQLRRALDDLLTLPG